VLEITKEDPERLRSSAEQVQWRRSKVLEYAATGLPQRRIAEVLQVSVGTINHDLAIIRRQAQKQIQDYEKALPFELTKTLSGLDNILVHSWGIAHDSSSASDRTRALALARDTYALKLELITKSEVVDNAVKYISNHKRRVTARHA
jgi:hypothetical protein